MPLFSAARRSFFDNCSRSFLGLRTRTEAFPAAAFGAATVVEDELPPTPPPDHTLPSSGSSFFWIAGCRKMASSSGCLVLKSCFSSGCIESSKTIQAFSLFRSTHINVILRYPFCFQCRGHVIFVVEGSNLTSTEILSSVSPRRPGPM